MNIGEMNFNGDGVDNDDHMKGNFDTFDISISLNGDYDDGDVYYEYVQLNIHDNITFDISISLNGESPTMSVLKLLSRMWVCLSSPDDDDDDEEITKEIMKRKITSSMPR